MTHPCKVYPMEDVELLVLTTPPLHVCISHEDITKSTHIRMPPSSPLTLFVSMFKLITRMTPYVSLSSYSVFKKSTPFKLWTPTMAFSLASCPFALHSSLSRSLFPVLSYLSPSGRLRINSTTSSVFHGTSRDHRSYKVCSHLSTRTNFLLLFLKCPAHLEQPGTSTQGPPKHTTPRAHSSQHLIHANRTATICQLPRAAAVEMNRSSEDQVLLFLSSIQHNTLTRLHFGKFGSNFLVSHHPQRHSTFPEPMT